MVRLSFQLGSTNITFKSFCRMRVEARKAFFKSVFYFTFKDLEKVLVGLLVVIEDTGPFEYNSDLADLDTFHYLIVAAKLIPVLPQV